MGGGYLIPTDEGLLFGATHDRDETARTCARDILAQPRAAGPAAPGPGRRLAGAPLLARAGVRAVTPDFLPLAGALAGRRGLFILSGLGSRGFCAAPLLAEHVAALALGAASPLPAGLSAIVDPTRIEARRHGAWAGPRQLRQADHRTQPPVS